MSAKSQHNNILLAILGFATVVVSVAVIGYFTLGKEEEIIQGEVEVSEYRGLQTARACQRNQSKGRRLRS